MVVYPLMGPESLIFHLPQKHGYPVLPFFSPHARDVSGPEKPVAVMQMLAGAKGKPWAVDVPSICGTGSHIPHTLDHSGRLDCLHETPLLA